MATNNSSLPEGTDTIISGASGDDYDDTTPAFDLPDDDAGTDAAAGSDAGKGAAGAAAEPVAAIGEAAKARTGDFATQAADRARDFATQGKDRATEALDNVAKLVSDAATRVDESVGEQYGAYARRAAEAVTGVADGLRNKDVDDLVEDAKALIRQSPAIAIGAAAAIGFALTRLAKAAVPESGATNGSGTTGGAENDVAFTPDSNNFGREG